MKIQLSVNPTTTFAKITCLIFMGLPFTFGISSADEFQVSLTGGSVITVDIDNETLPWTRVLSNGDLSVEQFNLRDIEQLVLSVSPASEPVSDIRRLLSALDSDDYLQRQSAEQQLSLDEMGGNFRTMIKSQADHPSYEVRHRVQRILEALDVEEVTPSISEFDILKLKDGTSMEGDVGKFKISGQFRNRKMEFTRADIRMISTPSSASQITAQENTNVRVEMFHSLKGNFYLPKQSLVDFDNSASGAEIKRFSNVNEMFIYKGLKLASEKEGFIGVSGYRFKFEEKPAAGNSVCVFETIGTYNKKFKGTIEISFCMPNQASVPAGVNEIGLLMARVNHSRDFIVEAYNSDGQILASVESSDEPCVFAGIKSNEPIAKLRILSNPYLFRIDRAIDEDFAVDSICFSSPVPIAGSKDDQAVVRLKKGDLIKGDSIEIDDASSVTIRLPNSAPIKVELDEIQAINFANQPAATGKKEANRNRWTAMLPDRSSILVEPGESFASESFAPLTFEPNELMAFWSARNPARFPASKDFDQGKTLLVFPTCRIAANEIKFTDKGFNWESTAEKLLQPIEIEGDEREEEDATPPFNSAQYSKSWPDSIPTVWLSPPKSPPAGSGRLRLADGQKLVLGNNASFQFVRLSDSEVTVATRDREFKIPLKNVLSIEFPTN